MALTPHRDMASAVTCMTTSSPGTAEGGENCSPTWHSDHTVDGVKIWCAGWKRNNKRWICSPLYTFRWWFHFVLFAVLDVCDGTQGRNAKDGIAAGRPGRVLPCSWNSRFWFKQIWFDFFFCFLFLKKKQGGDVCPLWYWEVVPDVLLCEQISQIWPFFLRVYCAKSSGSCFHNTHCIHNILDFHTTGKSIQWDLDLIRFEESQCSVLYYLDNEA